MIVNQKTKTTRCNMSVNFNSDAIRIFMLNTEDAVIFKFSRTCTQVNEISNDHSDLWLKRFAEEKIPLVESLPDQKRNYKADFKALYPITLSGKRIEQYFGVEVRGPLPRISAACFDKLSLPDPFDWNPKPETMGQTFMFIVVPHLMTRTSGVDFPFALDQQLRLTKKFFNPTAAPQELVFPYSIGNLDKLCSYPLIGKTHLPVFNPSAFTLCHASSKISIVFMRRNPPEVTKNTWDYTQKAMVKKEGFKVGPLNARALLNAFYVLKCGTCPDAQSYTYVKNAATSSPVFIGDFEHGAGMRISPIANDRRTLLARIYSNVAPAISAEVPKAPTPDEQAKK